MPVTHLPSPSKQKSAVSESRDIRHQAAQPHSRQVKHASNDSDNATTKSKLLQRDTPSLLARKPSTRLHQLRSPSKTINNAKATRSGGELETAVATSSQQAVKSANQAEQRTLRIPSDRLQSTTLLTSTTSEQALQTLSSRTEATEESSRPTDKCFESVIAYAEPAVKARPVSQISKLIESVPGPARPAIADQKRLLPSQSTKPVLKTAGTAAHSTPQFVRSVSTVNTISRSLSASPRKPLLTASRTNSTPTTTKQPPIPRLQPGIGTRALSSPLKPSQSTPSTKPQFTTHQRSFSPSKPSPISPPATTLPPNALRAQTHLLHHSLLHNAAAPTLAAYTASAHAQLHSLQGKLQALYENTLLLERKAKQAENVLALHGWAGGNVKSVGRRLNVLCSVLKEVMALSAPGGRKVRYMKSASHNQTALDETTAPERKLADDEDEEDEIEEQQGSYAHLIEAFTHWTKWVSEIWRDRERQDPLSLCSPSPPSTAYPTTPTPISTITNPTSATITAIDPLGDALKSSLRSLTTTLHALSLKLNELPPFPTTKNKTTISTPDHLLCLTRTLVSQMQEELQLIREIEFEVVIGEEAWMKQRLSTLSDAVEGGFLTPMRGR